MYEQVEKPKENKSKAAANAVAQKKGNVKQGFGFVDNRYAAVAQRIVQEMANNSPQNQQTIQLAKYTIKRDFPLSKGIKTLNKKEAERGKPEQSAKSRAKGELYAVLRSQYPLPKDKIFGNFEDEERARGEGYLTRKKMIDDEFENKQITHDQESVDIYRAAISPDKEDGSRAGSSQADGVTKGLGIKMIGAHLVKREWGGSDNMWNVVAWPQDAENKWAAGFEEPVDNAATWGLAPGKIDIEVEKEDEAIKKMRIESFIEGAIFNMRKENKSESIDDKLETSASRSLVPHFMDPINTERHKLNRIIESVPSKAIGTNNAPSIKTGERKTNKTEITTQDTEYQKVYLAAIAKLKKLAHKQIKKTTAQDKKEDLDKDNKWTQKRPKIAEGWKKKNPDKELPSLYKEGAARSDKYLGLGDSDARQKEKRDEERKTDWNKEKEAYSSKGFELVNEI